MSVLFRASARVEAQLHPCVFISAFGMVLGMFFDHRNCFVGFPWGFMKVVLGGRRRSLGSRWVWYNSVAQNAFVA